MADVLESNEELSRLAGAADALAGAVDADAGQLSDAAHAVAGRIHEARFEVAVVGEFNRGKSTLVNALIERPVLPFGALPVTSIPTELSNGDDGAVVRFMDGNDEVIDLTQLEQYVTEEANPGNARKVDSVTVTLPAKVLRHGAVLIDTPGLNSLFRHSADAARERIVQADGAIVVLSADAPLTEAERNLLHLLRKRSARTFFVLNRIDHMEDDDLERVGWFVENVLERVFGEPQELFRISARTGQGMAEFVDAFDRFLAEHLDEARIALARRDLAALADRVDDDIALEESALAMDVTELEDRVETFRQATAWQREGSEDDRILFEHAVGRIASTAGDRIRAAAAAPSPEAAQRIDQLVGATKRSELREAARELLERELKDQLDTVAREEAARAREGWQNAAERFQRATQRRVEKLRDVAGELFDVELQHTPTPVPIDNWVPSAQDEGFEDSQSAALSKMLRPLSSKRRRARALEALLASELKARGEAMADDLNDRLRTASAEVETNMERQIHTVAEAMGRAIQRAQEAKETTEEESERAGQRSSRLRDAAREARVAVDSVRA